MSSKWFAKHFACLAGREQKVKDKQKQFSEDSGSVKQQQEQTIEAEFEKMSIARGSKRLSTQNHLQQNGGGSYKNCAKDGGVKCCDKFCKNHCNLSMMRNELKGGRGFTRGGLVSGGVGRRSVKSSK